MYILRLIERIRDLDRVTQTLGEGQRAGYGASFELETLLLRAAGAAPAITLTATVRSSPHRGLCTLLHTPGADRREDFVRAEAYA